MLLIVSFCFGALLFPFHTTKVRHYFYPTKFLSKNFLAGYYFLLGVCSFFMAFCSVAYCFYLCTIIR
nr:MAG TPA: hypothetical protein [Caudoviricetes sp.]